METSTKYNRYAARIPKGMGVKGFGVGGGVVGSLSFSQGRGEGVRSCPGAWGGGGLAQFGSIRTNRKRGEGGVCKNWTFFMVS